MSMVITTKYISATNYRQARVSCTSWLGRTVTLWDNALNSTENHIAAIDAHLKTQEGLREWHYQVQAVGSNANGNGQTAIIKSVRTPEEAVSAAECWSADNHCIAD